MIITKNKIIFFTTCFSIFITIYAVRSDEGSSDEDGREEAESGYCGNDEGGSDEDGREDAESGYYGREDAESGYYDREDVENGSLIFRSYEEISYTGPSSSHNNSIASGNVPISSRDFLSEAKIRCRKQLSSVGYDLKDNDLLKAFKHGFLFINVQYFLDKMTNCDLSYAKTYYYDNFVSANIDFSDFKTANEIYNGSTDPAINKLLKDYGIWDGNKKNIYTNIYYFINLYDHFGTESYDYYLHNYCMYIAKHITAIGKTSNRIYSPNEYCARDDLSIV